MVVDGLVVVRCVVVGLFDMRISTVIFLLLTGILAQNLQAQPDVGVVGALHSVGMSGDAPNDAAWSSSFRYGGGVFAEQAITADIHGVLGLQWENRSTALEYTLPLSGFPPRDTTVDSARVHTNHLTIPMGLRIYGGSMHWFFSTGTTVQILQSASYDTVGSAVAIPLENVLRKFDVALYIGAGYQFQFHPFYPFVELRYQQGLINVIENKPPSVIQESPVIRMSGLSAMIGLAWRIL